MAIPAASQVADRNACLTLGPANQTIPIWEQLVNSRTVGLTFNDNTVYSWGWINLKDGPLAVEVPPKVLGAVNYIWFRWVVDLGITGPDKGKGGKYLVLPPGYGGNVPDGYFVVRSRTYNLWIPWRSFLVDGDPMPGVDLVKKFTKIYLLADKDKSAPSLKFVDVSGEPFNIINPADFQFWELLNQVVQEEPTESLDQIGLLRCRRHRKRQAIFARCANEENSDRSRCCGRRDRALDCVPLPPEGRLLLRKQQLAITLCRRGWILTRSATPSIALLHRQIHRQKSVPVSNRQLPPDFEGKQSAWQEGISSRFNEVGRCTSRQNSGGTYFRASPAF